MEFLPYNYIWSNGSNGNSLQNLFPGVYNLTVTDSKTCLIDTTVTILNIPNFIITENIVDPQCGNTDGSISLSVTGGVLPITAVWSTSPPQTGFQINNLAAGNYSVTITDSTGCSHNRSIILTDVGGPAVDTINISSVACSTSFAGVISIDVTSGTPPYSIVWSTGDTSMVINGLPQGNYTTIVTDNSGCVTIANFTVPVELMNINFQTIPFVCGVSNGSVTPTVTGGNSPYIFQWNTGSTDSTLTVTSAGGYSLTVTDAFGCTRHKNIYITPDSSCINTIKGTVFNDLNGNCIKDPGEPSLNNVKVYINGYVFTGPDGTFSRSISYLGTYSILITQSNQYLISCAPLPPVQFTSFGNNSFGNDIGVQVIPVQDIKVSMACGVARPGFTQNLSFTVSNPGTNTTSGDIVLILDTNVAFLNSIAGTPAPDVYDSITNTLTWFYNNLAMNAQQQYVFQVTIAVPPTVVAGTSLSHTVFIYPDSLDVTPNNNVSSCTNIATNAYDPNDKSVTPGIGPNGFIAPSDSLLHYIIRFQNTGNDTAFTVVIRDTLDQNLDWSTFETGTASHPYEVEFEQDNILVFTFNDILLPDSNVNEPGSHGHVTFYMKLKEDLSIGDVVKNTAAIYFDFNEPIITSTVRSTIANPDAVAEVVKQKGPLKVFPNPTGGAFAVIYESAEAGDADVMIMNYTGSIVYRQNSVLAKGINTIHIDDSLPQGIYLVRVSSGGESKIAKVVVVK